MATILNANEKQVMDDLLCEIDDDAINDGTPIMSVLVVHDDGAVASAFWTSVEKHKLRLPLESDEACIARHRKAAHEYHKG